MQLIEDVVQWTVLLVDGVDVAAAYRAIATELASEQPGLVTVALVAGLCVPGALVEIGAVADHRSVVGSCVALLAGGHPGESSESVADRGLPIRVRCDAVAD